MKSVTMTGVWLKLGIYVKSVFKPEVWLNRFFRLMCIYDTVIIKH